MKETVTSLVISLVQTTQKQLLTQTVYKKTIGMGLFPNGSANKAFGYFVLLVTMRDVA